MSAQQVEFKGFLTQRLPAIRAVCERGLQQLEDSGWSVVEPAPKLLLSALAEELAEFESLHAAAGGDAQLSDDATLASSIEGAELSLSILRLERLYASFQRESSVAEERQRG